MPFGQFNGPAGSTKSAELLVADFFPVTALQLIGCHNSEVADQVRGMLSMEKHQLEVRVQPRWYY